jgi:hypothetical protein
LVLTLVLAFLVPAASAVGTIRAYACVYDSGGNKVTPDTTYYKLGSTAFFNDGMENGCRFEDFSAGTTNVEVWTTYSRTTSQHLTQDISSSPIFNFYTKSMTMRLEKCDGTPLDGGVIAGGTGGSSSAWYWAGGATGSGTNNPGESTAEVFPGGTFNYEMRYNGTTERKMGITIQDPPQTLVWKPTNVEVFWEGQVSYGGGAGNSAWIKGSGTPGYGSKLLMPGTTRFHFRPVGGHPGYTRDITYGGCYHHAGYLTLIDEAGNPMANYGDPADTRDLKWKHACGGSWAGGASFETDAHGKTPFDIACANWAKIVMTLNQTAITQMKAALLPSNYTWQAAKVNANLKDHLGNFITDVPGGSVAQGSGYWYTHGTTGPSGQVTLYVFPGTIKLQMNYNHGSETKFPAIVAGTNDIDFQTGQLKLWFSGSIRSNAGGSWWNPTNPMELLPGNYNMCFSGPGHPESCVSIPINAGSVTEKTVAYIRLKNSDGTPQPNYTASWERYGAPPEQPVAGTPDVNGVLLNLMDGYNNTYYAYHWVTYLNAKSYTPLAQIPASNSFYDFQLTRVEVQLKDHAGNLMTGTGPDVYFYTYYSGTAGQTLFGTLNNGTVSRDLLQGYRHYFDIYDYNGTWQQVWQDNLTTPVVFQTFLVVDNGWGCTNYSQYGKPAYGEAFPVSGQVELLPGRRTYYKNNLGATQWFDVLVGGKTLDLSTGSVTP